MIPAISMIHENNIYHSVPNLTVGDFMQDHNRRPIISMEEQSREIIYILAESNGETITNSVKFYKLWRKISDNNAITMVEEEVVRDIPHMISIQVILEPILKRYPKARFFHSMG